MVDDRPDGRVLAILVTRDGEQWLGDALAGLAAQDHPDLEIIAVDNGSEDGSRRVLIDELGPDRVLVAERDLGFGAAVSMALDAAPSEPGDLVLLVHDDLVLEPGTLSTLVRELSADDRLAIVGPKLVEYDSPARLQNVGMTVDLTGRAESGLESDELDQGQRDHRRRSLYVSTAGMLVDRSVFDELGRFDRRYHLFRDDLDLCWRAWLAGYDVEVVPEAVGRHVAAAANYERLGQTAFLGPRYFAERNTLATLLKNYSGARLLYLVPAFFVVGVAKVAGFIATRRLGDAWQTVRAWLWNGWHLPRTWRLRRGVQARRERTDGELRPLFGRVAPRVRAYAEAMVDWLAGGEPDFDEVAPVAEAEPETATARVVAFTRRRPVVVVAIALLVLGIVGALPLLVSGTLRGGELAPWPDDAGVMLESYVSSWHDVGGFSTAAAPSPAQAILGALSVISFGSGWLASRLLVLGALPLAWLLSLRAARVVTPRQVPRLAAATLYALSPPALAAVTTGRVGTIVAVVALPAVVTTGATVLDPHAPTANAWRATAGLTLVAATLVAFVPSSIVILVAAALVAVAAVGGADLPADRKRAVAVRVIWAVLGMVFLLLPWSFTLLTGGVEVAAGSGAAAQPFWRWLLLAPELPGFAGIVAGGGLVVAGVLGLVFGAARRPAFVAGVWAVALAGVYVSWALARMGDQAWVWAAAPLLLTAGAFALLLAVALAAASTQLGQHAFGWRQLVAVATSALVAAGVVASSAYLLGDPWVGYTVDDPPIPSFIATETGDVGPFRVLAIVQQDGAVSWDLVGPEGPTMAAYGVPRSEVLRQVVGGAVTDLVGRVDPGAAGQLALANVRYVVVPAVGDSEQLRAALDDQLDLEPLPVAEGRLYRVEGWLPRASFLPRDLAARVDQRQEAVGGGYVAFERVDAGHYRGAAPGPGSVFVAAPADNGWEAVADGTALEATSTLGLMRFDVETPASEVTVEHARQPTRTALVGLQVFGVLVAISLMLRPPRFAEERP
ncbi:MAG: glycosyltransferase family 2 protein [Nitriliruptorales bacterium]|nr:glycosyltransferase family 2 protein [Nitriliruptorales bacterium]